jgi:hypothetical protein
VQRYLFIRATCCGQSSNPQISNFLLCAGSRAAGGRATLSGVANRVTVQHTHRSGVANRVTVQHTHRSGVANRVIVQHTHRSGVANRVTVQHTHRVRVMQHGGQRVGDLIRVTRLAYSNTAILHY